ncbi:MAG: bifunctional serine/threonine-protein kinase/formylglycine-generating enzyme family protein [Planctomycetota bacterium]
MTDDLIDDPLLSDAPLIEGFRVLDPCVLYARVGEGGMGAVFRGRHLNLDIDVAVKVMHASLAHGPEHVVRFQREARLAAQVQHDNLIRVFDVRSFEDLRYLVMEFVDGENARQRVRRKGPLEPQEAAAIVLAAARGLGKAHEQGVVHRDIKPDNILIAKNGAVKVADLGLAKAIEGGAQVTLTQQVMGTPLYMSPDQWEDARKVGPAADVWALGATFWFLLVGRDPIEGTSIADISRHVLHEPFPDLMQARPDVSPALAAIVARCVARKPEERFANARALATELGRTIGVDSSVPADVASTSVTLATMVSPPGTTLARIRELVTTTAGKGGTVVETQRDRQGTRRWSGIMSVLSGFGTLLMIGLLAAYWFGWLEPAIRWAFGVSPTPEVPVVVAGAPTLQWLEPWFSEDSADAVTTVRIAIVGSSDCKVRINGTEVRPENDGSYVRRLPLAQFGGRLIAEATDTQGRRGRIERVIGLKLENPWPDTQVADKGWAWFAGVCYPAQVVDPSSGVHFALIPSGQFKIGSPEGIGDADEHPQFTCEVNKPFYLGRTEVTVGEWRRFAAATNYKTTAEERNDANTWRKPGDNAENVPVANVTWADAQAFCKHFGYELPRESHWERAARANTDTLYWWGDDVLLAEGKANLLDLSRADLLIVEQQPAQLRDGFMWASPVASFAANAFGMFDIAGNVREWCRNGPGRYGTLSAFPIDEGQEERVTRGGSYAVDPKLCRSAARFPVAADTWSADIGFRVMKSF